MATTAQHPASPPANLPNGDSHSTPPAAPTAKKGKGKKEKPGEDEKAKLIAARLSQLEQEKVGAADQQAEVDKEVKKAMRDLNQSITNYDDPLQRLDVALKKYEDTVAKMKTVERDRDKNKKRADQLQKDQDKAKSEHNKTASLKDKLEKLCRELTKENKKVKDENKKLEDTEKTARITVNERMNQMLFDVQDVLNAKATSQGENIHIELDKLFRTRCKVLADQADLREMHFKTILRHKDAEIAHLGARHELERKRADAEATRCRTLTNQVSTFSHTEAELRSQLNIYVEKFKQLNMLTIQQVEDTLNNSNELFLTFRKEMEEMSKKTKRLEKENLSLTRKHESTNRNIIEMAEERTRDKEELEKLKKQETHMRSIIKTMQEQGRGVGVANNGPPDLDLVDEDNTESEYDEEYEDEDEDDDEGESFEGDVEDGIVGEHLAKPVFGPVPPPAMQTNGTKTAALVNGVKH